LHTAIEPLTHSQTQLINTKTTCNFSVQFTTAVERFVFLFFTITTSPFHGLCFFLAGVVHFHFFSAFSVPVSTMDCFATHSPCFFLISPPKKNTFPRQLKTTRTPQNGERKETKRKQNGKKEFYQKKNYLDIFYFLFYIASTPSIFSFSKLSLAFSHSRRIWKEERRRKVNGALRQRAGKLARGTLYFLPPFTLTMVLYLSFRTLVLALRSSRRRAGEADKWSRRMGTQPERPLP
jgi:hypothetical protein